GRTAPGGRADRPDNRVSWCVPVGCAKRSVRTIFAHPPRPLFVNECQRCARAEMALCAPYMTTRGRRQRYCRGLSLTIMARLLAQLGTGSVYGADSALG